MTSKELFIKELEEKLDYVDFSPEARQYFEELKNGKVSLGGFTDNGRKILEYMQGIWKDKENLFKSKDIGEALFMSGRSVSGSMRKLITDGYVRKVGQSPVIYGLTELGKTYEFDN